MAMPFGSRCFFLHKRRQVHSSVAYLLTGKTVVFNTWRVSTTWYWPAELREGCLFNSHRYPSVHTGSGNKRQWTRWLSSNSFRQTVKPTHFLIIPTPMNLNSIWQSIPDSNQRAWEIKFQERTKQNHDSCHVYQLLVARVAYPQFSLNNT